MKCAICGREIEIEVDEQNNLTKYPEKSWDNNGEELNIHEGKCKAIADSQFNREWNKKEWAKEVQRRKELKKYYNCEEILIGNEWLKITGRWKEDLVAKKIDSGFFAKNEEGEIIRVSDEFVEDFR